MILIPAERDHNSPSLGITLVEIVVEVKPSVFALAYLFVFIKDKSKVSRNRAFVNQWKTSLLNKSTRRYSITNQFYNKKATKTIKLGKLEAFCVAKVAGLIRIVAILFMLGN